MEESLFNKLEEKTRGGVPRGGVEGHKSATFLHEVSPHYAYCCAKYFKFWKIANISILQSTCQWSFLIPLVPFLVHSFYLFILFILFFYNSKNINKK